MNNREIEDIYPLSPMQQGMLYHSIYSPETAIYLEQLNCRLIGPLNIEAFQRSWQEVVRRHTILRTSFMWEDLDEPLQIVHRQVDLPLSFKDISNLKPDSQQETLDGLLADDLQTGFDLIEAPLMRLMLVKLEMDQFFLVWTHHHLLLDGWSMPILLKEVFTLYEAYTQGKDLYIRPGRPYRDYIGWLKQQDLAKVETYWRKYLKGFSAPTSVGIKTKFSSQSSGVAIEKASFGIELTGQLRKSSQQVGVTLNTWFQCAWGLLLSRYSHENDVVFGATVAGRPASLPGIDTMLGLFINTLPVRISIQPDQIVKDWLKTHQVQQAETRQYEYSPLVQIQTWSEIPPGQPLFDSILVFENYPVEESLKEQRGSLQIQDVRHYGKTNYPLTIVIAPGSVVEVHIVYDPGLFNQETIQRLLGHLKQILASMVGDPEQMLGQLEMLSPAEKELILFTWNHVGADIASAVLADHPGPRAATLSPSIIQLFEAQTALTPQADAVLLTENGRVVSSLTYIELKARIDDLADYLIQLGVVAEVLVGLSMERSIEMIVALLAVLKAGGAYVPLDPKYPPDRLAFMLADSDIQILLTQTNVLTGLADSLSASLEKLQVLCLDENLVQKPDSGLRISTPIEPSNAAYVIYTSGSTGQPKGVVIPHQALANHAVSMREALELGPGQRMMQLISLSFDAAAEEIYPTLISGAALILPEPALEISGSSILEFMEIHQVSVLHMPVPLWNTLVDELAVNPGAMPTNLRVVLVGGESPTLDRLAKWGEAAHQPMSFINAYGPTEATITTTYFKSTISPGNSPASDLALVAPELQIPIGRPIPNALIYILDSDLRPTPIGVNGEIYISGIGLARGYFKSPRADPREIYI